MIRLTIGPATIVDFDGTVTRLAIDWAALRSALRIDRIGDLWDRPGADWSPVTRAEVTAATSAILDPAMRSVLESRVAFAVITDNASEAIYTFFMRHADLRERLVAVAGREQLGGPKRDERCFARGYAACRDALRPFSGGQPITYIGDQDWELRFAHRLGAVAIDIAQLRDVGTGRARTR